MCMIFFGMVLEVLFQQGFVGSKASVYLFGCFVLFFRSGFLREILMFRSISDLFSV